MLDVPYDYPTAFFEGLSCVKKGKQQVFFGMDGHEVLCKDGTVVGAFKEGLSPFSPGGSYGYIDKTGRYVIEPQFRSAFGFSQGLALVLRQDGTWCYINHNGDVVLEGPWEDPGTFTNGLACVWLNGKYGYIDLSGELVLDCQWGDAYPFSNGYAAVRIEKNKGEMGYINTDGEYICGIKAQ